MNRAANTIQILEILAARYAWAFSVVVNFLAA
jgi:hypothetical protein